MSSHVTFNYTNTVPRTETLTSCMMISFCDNVASRPLCCTTSRFCHRLSERALFLSCSWTTGGDEMVDPAASISVLKPGGRFSRCRLCSISCCLDVSRYSWYRNARELKEMFRLSFASLRRTGHAGPAHRPCVRISAMRLTGCVLDTKTMQQCLDSANDSRVRHHRSSRGVDRMRRANVASFGR